jgi:Flp pilus assembly protein TadD
VLNRAPDHLPAQRNLGKALFLKGDERGGIEVMTAAVARQPEDAECRFLLGAAYRRVGEPNKAIRELEHCLNVDGNRGDALFHLGLARKSLGREDEARAAFMRALDLDPRPSAVGATPAGRAVRKDTGGVSRCISPTGGSTRCCVRYSKHWVSTTGR